MTAVATVEHSFRAAWPQWQAPPHTHGVAVAVTPGEATGWADLLLAREEHRVLVWAATGAAPAAEALALLDRPGVQAAALLAARTHPRRAGLAMQVASYLSVSRGRAAGTPLAALTSTDLTPVPSAAVRVPHLVTVRRGDGALAEMVVWEVLPAAVVAERLGVVPTDHAFVEAHLSSLVWLRGEAREHRFPSTAAGDRLARALAGGQLSIGFAYHNPSLIRALLGNPAMAGPVRAGPPPRPSPGRRGRDRGAAQ